MNIVGVALFRVAYSNWKRNRSSTLAAAVAFYSIFSVAPLALVVISIGSMILDSRAVERAFSDAMELTIGRDGASFIIEMARTTRTSDSGTIATVIGFLALLWGASKMFGEVQRAMNIIWHASPSRLGWRGFVRTRFVSFYVVISMGILTIGFLILNSVSSGFPRIVISFATLLFMFALLFKMLPDIHIMWKSVWLGACLTAILFVLGLFLMGLYFDRTSFMTTYGAAGSLVALLVWIYYSAQIFFFGAEFTHACCVPS